MYVIIYIVDRVFDSRLLVLFSYYISATDIIMIYNI